MDAPVTYRPMEAEEAPAVCRLVGRIFNEFVAPAYPPEGAREFLKYVEPAQLIGRLQNNHSTFVAESHGRIVGMVEARNGDHISLLFVEPGEQRKGIARGLMRQIIAMHHCRRLTVHSSPNALPAYVQLGFKPDGQEQIEHGIRFIPMTWSSGK